MLGERSHFLQFVQSALGNVQMKDPNQVIGEGMSEQEALITYAKKALESAREAYLKNREVRSYVQSSHEFFRKELGVRSIECFFALMRLVASSLNNAVDTEALLDYYIKVNRFQDAKWAADYLESALKSVEAAYDQAKKACDETCKVYELVSS